MPPDLIPEGDGLPGAFIERVECPVHGDTWAFGPGNTAGYCMEAAKDGDLGDTWGYCTKDPVRVRYEPVRQIRRSMVESPHERGTPSRPDH